MGQRLQAAAVLEAQVQQRHVRAQRPRLLDRPGGAVRLAHHHQVLLALQHAAQPFQKHAVVIDEQHGSGSHGVLLSRGIAVRRERGLQRLRHSPFLPLYPALALATSKQSSRGVGKDHPSR